MDGSQIRKAREAAELGQIPFASRAGIARSGLQHLEATGNGTIATLERVIASLPTLHTITLGGRDFVALDHLTQLLDHARQLTEIFHAGATRFDGTGVDEATRARAAGIEDAIARGELDPEEDS